MTVRIPAVERIAEGNLRRSAISEEVQKRISKEDVDENIGPYLAISRETGAAGGEILRLVGQRLGWDVLDKEIVDTLAAVYGTVRQTVESMDEKRGNWIDESFSSWIQGQGFTSSAYVHRIPRLFLHAAHQGKVVIVGRGARYLLPRDSGLSIRVVAPLEYRIARVQLRKSVSEREASQLVQQSVTRREAFIQEHFHHRAADPHMYDLVVNVERLSTEDVADTICETLRRWMGKSDVRQSARPN